MFRYLLSNQPGNQQAGQHKSVTDLMPMIGARFYTQLDALQLRSDVLENELTKELENGRLARLLVKMGTINERPELVFIFLFFIKIITSFSLLNKNIIISMYKGI